MPATAPSVWVKHEEDGLIDALIDHQPEGGDNCTFKKSTFEKAAVEIAPLLTKGPSKDAGSLQNKWGALRKTYRVIQDIKAVSGWAWDDATGASITAEIASSWDDYVAKHPKAKPFRNKGWHHLAKMSILLGQTSNTTATVFHPLSSQTSASSGDAIDGSDSDSPATQAIEGDDVSDDEDADPPVAPVTAGKRSREPSTSAPPSKRVRTSGSAQAFQAVVASMDRFNDTIAKAFATPTNTVPIRLTNTISAVMKNEGWLNRAQKLNLIKVFQADKTGSACDVYNTFLNDDETRMDWIADQINLPSPCTALE